MNKKKVNISSYLLRRILLIVPVVSLFIITLVYNYSIKNTQNIIFANLNNHIDFEQSIINNFIYESKKTFRNIELLYLLDQNFSSNESLNHFFVENNQIAQIMFIDDEGIVQHVYPEDSVFSDYDLSKLRIFKNITDKANFSDAYINNLTGNTEIYLSKKMDSTNLIVSYIIGPDIFTPLNYLNFEVFDTQIIDDNNLVIYSNKNNYTYNKTNIEKTENITYEDSSFLISKLRPINGETYYFIDRKIEPLSWTIKFSVNDTYINRFLYPVYAILSMLIIILLLLIYQIKLFTKKFNEPLYYINNHFDEIAKHKITPFTPPISIFNEMTDLYKHYISMYEKLKNREKELNQFVYMASHDLQEPLRMISSYMDIIEIEYLGELDKTGQKYFNYVTDSAKRMKYLIQDLLLYSRTGSGYCYENINLKSIFEKIFLDLSLTIKDKNATILVDDLPIIRGDYTKLRQLFQNLILNALKFSRNDIPPIIHISYDSNLVEIIVADNGIGIEEKYLQNIFQPFRKLHSISEYEGTGIGLAICKKVVEYHGWKIKAKSEFGLGTQFIITIKKEY